MNRRYVFFLAFAFVSCFFISCKDDPVSPAPQPLLPGQIGSWWKYEKFFLDSNKIRIQDSIEYDSMAVTGKTEKEGKTASVYTTFISDSQDGPYIKDNDAFFVNDGQNILTHSGFFTDMFKEMPNFELIQPFFPNAWVTLIDSKNAAWDIFSVPIDTINFPFQGLVVPVYGSIDIAGAKGSVGEYVINYKKVATKEYKITITLNLTGEIYGLPIKFSPSRILHLYFVEGLGMVKTHLEPSSFTVPLIGFKIRFSGEESELRTYYLAN